MSFQYGVEDLLIVVTLAGRVRKGFVGAPQQFSDIQSEARNLSNILQHVEDVYEAHSISNQQRRELQGILTGCLEVLSQLEELLNANSELQSSGGPVGSRAKRVWKKLNWERQSIHIYRDRIASNVLLLNTFLGQLSNTTIVETKKGVDQLHQRQIDQDWLKILQWLDPVDYSLQQTDFSSRRQPGTGQWLLEEPAYHQWVKSAGQSLFCPGIPGAGKTILTSLVVSDLISRYSDDPETFVAYLYCNFRRSDEQEARSLLANLLKQLAHKKTTVIEDLYDHHQARKSRPSMNDISKALKQVVAQHSRVFIAIDALDETSNECLHEMRSEIYKLQNSQNVNIFITSRFIPSITDAFRNHASIEIRASRDDVKRYIDDHLMQMPSCVKRNQDLQAAIAETISDATDGMFLLAQLYLRMLQDKMTPKAVRRALQYLQKQSSGSATNAKSQILSDAYSQAMDRINKQQDGIKELAMHALSWISCAQRPLTTKELRVALVDDVEDHEPEEDSKVGIEDVAAACAGLVVIDEQSDIIRLVHYTTQEYFEQTQLQWFPKAHTKITRLCIKHLSFPEFECQIPRTENEHKQRLQVHPLYEYASSYWGRHARYTSDLRSDIMLFLKKKELVVASSQILCPFGQLTFEEENIRRPGLVTGLFLAVYFGLVDVLETLINSRDFNVQDIQQRLILPAGGTQLWDLLREAAYRGGKAIMTLLLSVDGIDANLKDEYGRVPLFTATLHGHRDIVQLLLLEDGVNVNLKDKNGWTPLFAAVQFGHKDIIQLLLSAESIDVDSKDDQGRTPLSIAAYFGDEDVVRLLLLADGFNPDWKNNDGWTPLSLAAQPGHIDVVHLLLSRDGVDTNSQDKHGSTPLSKAAANGYTDVVRLLLSYANIEADLKCQHGYTALHLAARHGHEDVVRLLLLVDGVDINSKSDEGTPLSMAAEHGHRAVVGLLTEADVNASDALGRTPLFFACRCGHVSVVQRLLQDARLDPSRRDWHGSTALLAAVRNGHLAIVQLLMQNQSSLANIIDGFGMTPENWAMRTGQKEMLQLLQHFNGMVSRNDTAEVALSVPSIHFDSESSWCDACTLTVAVGAIYFACPVDCSGGFALCKNCFREGTLCPESLHELTRKTRKS